MENTDKHEFKSILGAVMDLYGKELSVPLLQLWFSSLQRFSMDEVRAGLSRYVQSADSGSFAPKPADIIRMIEGSAIDRGTLAWGKVIESIRRVGGYQSVCFDDAIIHCVIEDMGGWGKLCATEEIEIHFRAADFAKRYRAYAERGGPDRFSPYLTGRSEEQNRIQGHKTAPPMLVGDQAKCALILEKGRSMPRIDINQIPSVGLLIGRMKNVDD